MPPTPGRQGPRPVRGNSCAPAGDQRVTSNLLPLELIPDEFLVGVLLSLPRSARRSSDSEGAAWELLSPWSRWAGQGGQSGRAQAERGDRRKLPGCSRGAAPRPGPVRGALCPHRQERAPAAVKGPGRGLVSWGVCSERIPKVLQEMWFEHVKRASKTHI